MIRRDRSVWQIYTDGAIRPKQGKSGLAAIIRDEKGEVRYLWRAWAGKLTCNEAEYAAAIFAFENLLKLSAFRRPASLIVYSDSRVMVDQMSGLATARAEGLRLARNRLRHLIANFNSVSFQYIPREQNRLADALAFEAVEQDSEIWRAKWV